MNARWWYLIAFVGNAIAAAGAAYNGQSNWAAVSGFASGLWLACAVREWDLYTVERKLPERSRDLS